MSYVIVERYGPPVAHQVHCWTLRGRTLNETVDVVPAGSVICVHCHPVPAEAREPEWDEDGFIIVRDPHHKGRMIAHHPLCRTLTSRHMGGARWTHRHATSIPPTAKVCGLCQGRAPRFRQRRPDGTMRAVKPRGEYDLVYRPGKKPILVPVCCPVCSGKALDREGRSWFCYSCDWMGKVTRKLWTLREREVVESTEGGAGHATIRTRIQTQVLRGTPIA